MYAGHCWKYYDFWRKKIIHVGKVSFAYADRQLRIGNKTAIKASVEALFITENTKLSHINYIFCSDEFLLNINTTFLQHDTYTDIITFDLTEDISSGIIGEVYISLDRVKENSSTYGSGFMDELLRVIYHGALHLCGYKDKQAADRQLMRQKEAHYIASYYNKYPTAD